MQFQPDTRFFTNLVPRVLSLPSSRKEERGPWERGWFFRSFVGMKQWICAVTSQHGGGHSYYGSNRKKRCPKWRTFHLEVTTDFGRFTSLSKGKIHFSLLFTTNLSYFSSLKLPYKIQLLAFPSPLRMQCLCTTQNWYAAREFLAFRLLNSWVFHK